MSPPELAQVTISFKTVEALEAFRASYAQYPGICALSTVSPPQDDKAVSLFVLMDRIDEVVISLRKLPDVRRVEQPMPSSGPSY